MFNMQSFNKRLFFFAFIFCVSLFSWLFYLMLEIIDQDSKLSQMALIINTLQKSVENQSQVIILINQKLDLMGGLPVEAVTPLDVHSDSHNYLIICSIFGVVTLVSIVAVLFLLSTQSSSTTSPSEITEFVSTLTDSVHQNNDALVSRMDSLNQRVTMKLDDVCSNVDAVQSAFEDFHTSQVDFMGSLSNSLQTINQEKLNKKDFKILFENMQTLVENCEEYNNAQVASLKEITKMVHGYLNEFSGKLDCFLKNLDCLNKSVTPNITDLNNSIVGLTKDLNSSQASVDALSNQLTSPELVNLSINIQEILQSSSAVAGSIS